MIKNIIFDIGNVLVKWSPKDIVAMTFPQEQDIESLALKIFKSPTWIDLNLGKFSELDAIEIYHLNLGIDKFKLTQMMENVHKSLTPLPGSFELLDRLYKAEIPLYSITDNVHEIISYLHKEYNFLPKFKGVAVSADIGVLKPNPVIYNHLIDKYNLAASECLFIDDLERNVLGAKQVGMQAVQFTTAQQLEHDLIHLFDLNF